ncbi:MAG: carbonic anhydrase [candidate division Zixibacteria bacterium]
MAEGIFATAINCMDGRTQLPVNKWMKDKFRADYIDTITEPGPDKILTSPFSPLSQSIKQRVLISVEKHNSSVIAIVAHDQCAGNPVSRDEHIAQLKKAMETVKSWNLSVDIHGVWIGSNWQVEEIDSIVR